MSQCSACAESADGREVVLVSRMHAHRIIEGTALIKGFKFCDVVTFCLRWRLKSDRSCHCLKCSSGSLYEVAPWSRQKVHNPRSRRSASWFSKPFIRKFRKQSLFHALKVELMNIESNEGDDTFEIIDFP